jgi:hypothetical protein
VRRELLDRDGLGPRAHVGVGGADGAHDEPGPDEDRGDDDGE